MHLPTASAFQMPMNGSEVPSLWVSSADKTADSPKGVFRFSREFYRHFAAVIHIAAYKKTVRCRLTGWNMVLLVSVICFFADFFVSMCQFCQFGTVLAEKKAEFE